MGRTHLLCDCVSPILDLPPGLDRAAKVVEQRRAAIVGDHDVGRLDIPVRVRQELPSLAFLDPLPRHPAPPYCLGGIPHAVRGGAGARSRRRVGRCAAFRVVPIAPDQRRVVPVASPLAPSRGRLALACAAQCRLERGGAAVGSGGRVHARAGERGALRGDVRQAVLVQALYAAARAEEELQELLLAKAAVAHDMRVDRILHVALAVVRQEEVDDLPVPPLYHCRVEDPDHVWRAEALGRLHLFQRLTERVRAVCAADLGGESVCQQLWAVLYRIRPELLHTFFRANSLPLCESLAR